VGSQAFSSVHEEAVLNLWSPKNTEEEEEEDGDEEMEDGERIKVIEDGGGIEETLEGSLMNKTSMEDEKMADTSSIHMSNTKSIQVDGTPDILTNALSTDAALDASDDLTMQHAKTKKSEGKRDGKLKEKVAGGKDKEREKKKEKEKEEQTMQDDHMLQEAQVLAAGVAAGTPGTGAAAKTDVLVRGLAGKTRRHDLFKVLLTTLSCLPLSVAFSPPTLSL